MIGSAEEFVRLRCSTVEADYNRASNEEAALEVWKEVIVKHPEMKSWVAHNKTVPLEILEELSTDSSVEVRGTVAMKRKLSPEIFERLSCDPDVDIRVRILRNPKVPYEIVTKLLTDADEYVREEAEKRLSR